MTRFQATARGTCGTRACRVAELSARLRQGVFRQAKERSRLRAERAATQHEGKLARATMLRGELATAQGVRSPESYAVIVLPANPRRPAPLSRRRRYRFAGRLAKLLEGMVQESPNKGHAAPAPQGPMEPAASVMAEACATCGGRCCRRGGTRAYLDEALLQRVRRLPGLNGARDILEAYCRHLPETSYSKSCVFQSATGCTLPPEMRANTCHNFVCSGLSEIQDRIVGRGDTRFFLAATGPDRNNMRGVFVSTAA